MARCTSAAAGEPARGIDPGPGEPDEVELAQRRLELVVEGRRGPGPDTDESVEVLVERRLEIVGILPRDPALLDTSLQLGDHGVEVGGAARVGLVSRIRRHGVNLAEDLDRDRRRASVPNLGSSTRRRSGTNQRAPPEAFGTMANDRLSESVANEPLPRDGVRAEIEAAARADRHARRLPLRLRGSRTRAGARFALRTAAPDDIRAAIALLEEQTNVQALAPIDSRNRGVDATKKVVRKAVFFAVNHVTEQMRAMGWAATSVGVAAAERIEQLEARVQDLESRLDLLDARAANPEDAPPS